AMNTEITSLIIFGCVVGAVFMGRALIVVSFWLVVIFLTFSLIAPHNGTATFALIISAVAAATAIFLVLALDRPFSGLLRISNEPMLNVLSQLEKSTQ